MAQVIIYNPTSPAVPNRVVDYKRSVQESDWALVPNTVIYHASGDPPEVAALIAAAVPMSLWKVAGGLVEQLSQADLDALAAQAATDALAAQTERLKQRRLNKLSICTPTAILMTRGLNPDIYPDE